MDSIKDVQIYDLKALDIKRRLISSHSKTGNKAKRLAEVIKNLAKLEQSYLESQLIQKNSNIFLAL